MDFNYTENDIRAMGVNALCEQAYQRGRADGAPCPGMLAQVFRMGMGAGECCTLSGFDAATTVLHVYRNGDNTVLEFADGTKTRVTYHAEYGYAYDDEKAIMAAMLKRLVGSSYIAVLREFARYPARNVSDGMVRKAGPEPMDPLGEPTTDPVAADLYGTGFTGEDEALFQEFQTMDTEPVFDPQAFTSTDPVTQALLEKDAMDRELAGADPDDEEC